MMRNIEVFVVLLSFLLLCSGLDGAFAIFPMVFGALSFLMGLLILSEFVQELIDRRKAKAGEG